uniref:Uncharacterized protein n=1 Tax=Oncorhynchus kisutch TaxID=8019 RepID=A0A8C7IEQ6_ONCKI
MAVWAMVLPRMYLNLVLTLLLFLLAMGVRMWLQRSRKARLAQDSSPTVAFSHPYCNAEGGWERVPSERFRIGSFTLSEPIFRF